MRIQPQFDLIYVYANVRNAGHNGVRVLSTDPVPNRRQESIYKLPAKVIYLAPIKHGGEMRYPKYIKTMLYHVSFDYLTEID